MIEQLRIKNFRSLRDTSVDLAPLTVLVGPNDSGKTTLLHAIHSLGQLAEWDSFQVFRGDFAFENITWRRKQTDPIDIRAIGRTEHDSFEWGLSLFHGGRITADTIAARGQVMAYRHGEQIFVEGRVVSTHDASSSVLFLAKRAGTRGVLEQISNALTSRSIYRLDPRLLRSRSVPEAGAILTPTGDNLASVLDGLITGPDRDIVVAMEKALHEALPSLKGFAVRPPPEGKPGEKSIEFVLSGSKPVVTIPCALASDGAMLLTAYLALAYSDTPGILLIEEPENGLHPRRIGELMTLLRKMTTGEVGNRARQIILTTHSPLLLNYAQPEEVRIVLRDQEQGTKVTAMKDVADLEMLRKEFDLGEIWYMLGDEALARARADKEVP